MVRGIGWLIAVSLLLGIASPAKVFAQSDDLAGLNRQIEGLYQAGRFVEAIVVAQSALALAERLHGPGHIDVGNALGRLAVLYVQQGRYEEAERVYKRVLSIKEGALGSQHTEVGSALYGLAVLYVQQGRYAEAEPLYKRALAIKEQALGPEHTEVGTILYGLAALYVYLGRHEDAEPLYRRTLTIKERALGPDHSEVGSALHNLAVLLSLQNRLAEAEPLYQRVIAIKEGTLGPDHTELGTALFALAELFVAQGRYTEAEPVYRRVLAIKEKALGAEHSEVGTALYGLAGLHAHQGRYAEAELLYKRVLDIKLGALGPDHPEVGLTLGDIASNYFKQSQWDKAADYWQQSAQVVIRRARRGTDSGGERLIGKATSEAQRERLRFEGLIKASYRLANRDTGIAPDIARDMFAMAQWSQSSQAATSLAQMAARQAKGGGALADLVRERQDLVEDWQAKDRILLAARSEPPARRNAQSETAIAARLSDINRRLGEIDRTLAKDFPEYATLANPRPASVADVQATLGTDEALVLMFDTRAWYPAPEETFVWVVTKASVHWVKTDQGTRALTERVAALRCGLDQASWEGDGANRCASLLDGIDATEGARLGKPLPFDLARAHGLYEALFGQIDALIKDKHVLIVPSGPLTAIPLQVLTTQKPAVAIPEDETGYANAAWFAKRNAITVLPSVASLIAVRQFARASKATQPYIGFGNPLLTGPSGDDRRAWLHQKCSNALPRGTASAGRSVREGISRFFQGNLADVDLVRRQQPLPETADELCAVARSAGAPEAAVYLGEKASETTIKALSASGVLANARVVHFATHGLLAGESRFVGTSKPETALLLTPPAMPTETDDGLLTASEVAQLKLDADWVVLSACNTAAGARDTLESEALSGLARAFFYAGARALLVSHWAVDSQATVGLVTKTFDLLKADPSIGRAEALRRSMLALIGTGGRNAHPATWAPFVVVGEGRR